MRVLVIGSRGQLGTDLCGAFEDTELFRTGSDFPLDITSEVEVRKVLEEEVRPRIVVNAAAFLNLPRCENEPAMAFAVNAMGAKYLAISCQRIGARLVHVSTDYVFGNGGTRPYVETDREAPLSTYAVSKLAGEHLIAAECEDYCIVRTSGLYGKAPCRAKDGKNFVQLMLHLAAERGELRVVTDERVSPTYTASLARQIRVIAEHGRPGCYHATCDGECSWYEFTEAIFEETNTEVTLLGATHADFPSPVRRPDYSVLDNKNLRDQGLDIMPPWREALLEYLAAIGRRQPSP